MKRRQLHRVYVCGCTTLACAAGGAFLGDYVGGQWISLVCGVLAGLFGCLYSARY